MRKILYTKFYGAGWTSWNEDTEVKKFLLSYQPLIEAIEEENRLEIDRSTSKQFKDALISLEKDLKEKFGNKYVCISGAEHLEIEELLDGVAVQITDFDGKENIEYDRDWI